MANTCSCARGGEEALVVEAIGHLKAARDLLRKAGAVKTVERVRLALSSAEGALRNAYMKPRRAARG